MSGYVDGAERPAPTGLWFGDEGQPLLGWLSRPESPAGRGAVVVPTVGYDYWPTHRTLRAIAEGLAADGTLVLRYDHHGTGDSAGSALDPERLATWRSGVVAAVAALRDLGCSDVVLVGMQLGATLALLAAEEAGGAAAELIAPVVGGRRWVRGVRLVAQPVDDAAYPEGTITHGGTVMTPSSLAEIQALDLTSTPAGRLTSCLVVEAGDRPVEPGIAAHLRSEGIDVESAPCDLAPCLERPTEYAEVPYGLVDVVRRWVGRLHGPAGPGPAAPPAPGRPGPVPVATGATEEVVHVAGLAGVWCEPTGGAKGSVVLLNSGSEPHIGPGRAWVELARGLAGAGWASLRVDFSGWGESPDRGRAPGRPYDAHCVVECCELAGELSGPGRPRPIAFGLCAGAWVALRALGDGAPLGGVVALNPQLYWQPGDPVEADIVAETHVRRLPEIARHRRLRRAGVWDALDRLGVRHPAARWLDRVAGAGVPTLMLFTEGDDGLEFLEQRLTRSWRAARRQGVDLAVVDDLDHSLRQNWRRPALLAEMVSWLDATCGPGGEGA